MKNFNLYFKAQSHSQMKLDNAVGIICKGPKNSDDMGCVDQMQHTDYRWDSEVFISKDAPAMPLGILTALQWRNIVFNPYSHLADTCMERRRALVKECDWQKEDCDRLLNKNGNMRRCRAYMGPGDVVVFRGDLEHNGGHNKYTDFLLHAEGMRGLSLSGVMDDRDVPLEECLAIHTYAEVPTWGYRGGVHPKNAVVLCEDEEDV